MVCRAPFAFFLRRRSLHDDGVCGRGVRSLSGPVPGGTAQAGGAAISSMGPSNVSFTQFELPTAPTMPHTSGTTPFCSPSGSSRRRSDASPGHRSDRASATSHDTPVEDGTVRAAIELAQDPARTKHGSWHEQLQPWRHLHRVRCPRRCARALSL